MISASTRGGQPARCDSTAPASHIPNSWSGAWRVPVPAGEPHNGATWSTIVSVGIEAPDSPTVG
jgi:hypothetical protein